MNERVDEVLVSFAVYEIATENKLKASAATDIRAGGFDAIVDSMAI